MQTHITEDAHRHWPRGKWKSKSQEDSTTASSEYVRRTSDHIKGWNVEKTGHVNNVAEMK